MIDETTNQSGDLTRSEVHRARRTLEGVLGYQATEGNRVAILRNGDEIFPPMLEEIANAHHTIDFLTFVYWKGEIGTEFANRLAERAKAGVRVRVLLDAWGARPIEKSLIKQMDDAGVILRWFRPLRRILPRDFNHRTHRKILVVDESVAFTGGVGISDLWLGDARNEHEWRDTHFKIEGPAVDGLRAAFLENWSETDPVIFEAAYDRFPDQPQFGGTSLQCVPGVSATGGSDMNSLFRTLLQLAQRQFRITTAYFVPDENLNERLCEAAGRGVHVQILLPGPFADKRFVQIEAEADYGRLIKAGVELWNYQTSMLHAKVMTMDGIVANVGSANFNARSLNCDDEINLMAFDRSIVKVLDEHFELDLERSSRVSLAQWKKRSMLQRGAELLVKPMRRIS
jgi:cardiolipin synthase